MTQFISYLRASLRLWRKQWVGVLIALTGLVGALAISLLTTMYLYDSTQSDKWLETSDRLFRVNQKTLKGGGLQQSSLSPLTVVDLGPLIKDAVPGVEAVTRMREILPIVGLGETETSNESWIAVDAEFVSMFPLPMVAGSLEYALGAPNRVAFSETHAAKYGGLDAVGRIVEITLGDEMRSVEVAAVFKDIPSNSHLSLTAITLLYEGTMPTAAWMHMWPNIHTYVLAQEGFEQVQLKADFGSHADALIPINQFGRSYVNKLEAVEGLMLHSEIRFGGLMKAPLNKDYLFSLCVVAGVLLVSAGFNFITVFTAINLLRGREFAVRQLAGVSSRTLFYTGWGESSLLALLAFALALLVAADLVPFAGQFLGSTVSVFDSEKLPVFLAGIALVLLFALLASAYGSAVILRRRPADLMRDGQGALVGGGTLMRQSLVFVQAFVLTGVLGAAAQIHVQNNHLMTMDRGIAQTGVMYLSGPQRGRWKNDDFESLKAPSKQFRNSLRNEVENIAGVTGTAITNIRPFGAVYFLKRMRNPLNNELQELYISDVGPDYFGVAGIRVLKQLAGDFSQFKYPIAIEKSHLPGFGFETIEDALGYELVEEQGQHAGEITKHPHKIVAVIDDTKIQANGSNQRIMYGLRENKSVGMGSLAIEYDVLKETAIRQELEALWVEMMPDFTFALQTVEEAIAAQHKHQVNSGIAVSIIAGICAILGFAGLYGMATHWLTTRARELALRRVLGASRSRIQRHAAGKMLIPILLGTVLGVMPAVWASQQWLQKFADQAPLPTVAFVGGGALIIIFAMLSLLMHIKTALQKHPARVLYHE